MTENHDLVPEADVEEQREPARGDYEVEQEQTGPGFPLEANPADVAEQAASVPLDEDEENRPAT